MITLFQTTTVGATVKQQLAKVHVPPVVLLPTPPTTTAPYAKHPDVELHTWLQLPAPIKPANACALFAAPPTIAEYIPVAQFGV